MNDGVIYGVKESWTIFMDWKKVNYLSSIVIVVQNTFLSNHNKAQSVTKDSIKNGLY